MTLDRFYFILSQPRSGSTLLRLHLNKDPNVIALPETHFFNFKHKYRHLDPVKDAEELISTWLNYFAVCRMALNVDAIAAELRSAPLTWKRLFETTLLHYARTYHPTVKDPVWIEKTPPHIFYKADIKAMYPDAQFVFLVRDPRSVVASTRGFAFSTSNVVLLSKSWQKSIQHLAETNPHILIRYEDLVTDPEGNLGKVFDFMGLRGNPNPDEGVLDQVEKKNPNSWETVKPIHADNLEKWKRLLSKTDGHSQIVEHICRKGMAQYGYTPENGPKKNGYYAQLWSGYLHIFLVKFLNLIRPRKR